MSELNLRINYNPDVLTCLANLSNDEIFTPPNIANQMLDLLPQELFSSPDSRFLDPACKSGVFLREIAKRLIDGLQDEIPDLQERLDHIYHHQIYGIAITELTSLMARRSLYCSKYPNSVFSISHFEDVQGNIRFKQMAHTWKKGTCVYCGANQEQFDRGDEFESHAYEFIHTDSIEEILKMKFDVIVSNPPYHLDTAGAGRQAKPIYNKFVEQAKKLNPRYISMIIPSRWFAGGMNLDSFRESMRKDSHLSKVFDYTNAKDCFPENSISGGVCYFLWERDHNGDCQFTNINNDKKTTTLRALDEFNVIVRYNEAVLIIHKIRALAERSIDTIISPLMPFGLSTNYRGSDTKKTKDQLSLHASNGITYVDRNSINKGINLIDKYKILISKTSAEHAGEPGSSGKFKVFTSSLKVINPGDICTHSYFIIGCFDEKEQALNALSYLKTRFVRFLVLQSMSSINLSKNVFSFVPTQDFSKPWNDEELYKKYDLIDEEIALIESMIRPMDTDVSGGPNA